MEYNLKVETTEYLYHLPFKKWLQYQLNMYVYAMMIRDNFFFNFENIVTQNNLEFKKMQTESCQNIYLLFFLFSK